MRLTVEWKGGANIPPPPPPFQALASASLRVDGRAPHDVRPPSFTFSPDGAVATVALGDTLATACVGASLEAPYQDR